MFRLSAALAVLAPAFALAAAPAKKIVAVGDSITYGAHSSNIATYAWPEQLGHMLGSQNATTWTVQNLGLCGRTMMRTGDAPYWREKFYQQALTADADYMTIMLGTNDAKSYQWNQTQYQADYLDMVRSFVYTDLTSSPPVLRSKVPEIYAVVPPPLYREGVYGGMRSDVINGVLPVLTGMMVKTLNKEFASYIAAWKISEIKFVDTVFKNLGGSDKTRYELFCDGQSCDQCHPNDSGYANMAASVYAAMFPILLPTGASDGSEKLPDYNAVDSTPIMA